MEQEILVYDDMHDIFRKLDTTNYNDDLVVGTIFLRRDALAVFKKYFIVCGYTMFDKDGSQCAM